MERSGGVGGWKRVRTCEIIICNKTVPDLLFDVIARIFRKVGAMNRVEIMIKYK